MMDNIVNLKLLLSPYNWITVVLMVGFGVLMLAVLAPQTSTPGDT